MSNLGIVVRMKGNVMQKTSIPMEGGGVPPNVKDLRLEHNHDTNLRELDDSITSGISHYQIFTHANDCFIELVLYAQHRYELYFGQKQRQRNPPSTRKIL